MSVLVAAGVQFGPDSAILDLHPLSDPSPPSKRNVKGKSKVVFVHHMKPVLEGPSAGEPGSVYSLCSYPFSLLQRSWKAS